MKTSKRLKKPGIWEHGKGEQFLQEQLEALDIRDNIPPQLLAVISSVLEAIDMMDKGDTHESKSSSI
jgi:hypothetical protein